MYSARPLVSPGSAPLVRRRWPRASTDQSSPSRTKKVRLPSRDSFGSTAPRATGLDPVEVAPQRHEHDRRSLGPDVVGHAGLAQPLALAAERLLARDVLV